MKKMLITFVLVIVASFSTIANTTNISRQVEFAFETEFKGATNVQWQETPSFIQVSFIQYNKQKVAYYQADGTLIGTSENLPLEQLPTSLKRILAKKYPAFTLSSATVLSGNGDDEMYIRGTTAQENTILKVTAGGISVIPNF